MGPSFKEKFVEIRTCESHEQCMGPTQKMQPIHKRKRVCIQTNTTWTFKKNTRMYKAFKLLPHPWLPV